MPKYHMDIIETPTSDTFKRALQLFVNKLVKDGVKPGNITRNYSPYTTKTGMLYSCQIDWWTQE